MPHENLVKLRELLAGLPDSKFNMSAWNNAPRHDDGTAPPLDALQHACGTVCCIGGWAQVLLQVQPDDNVDAGDVFYVVGAALGLGLEDTDALFMPIGWYGSVYYTRARALATLDHLIATGVVDWEVGR